MTQLTHWEKPAAADLPRTSSSEKLKFMIGGALILGAVAFLLISGTLSGARYFITVDDLVSDPQYVGQAVRVTGAVIGDTIQYDSENLIIRFVVADVDSDSPELGEALHLAVNDPAAARMQVRVENQVKPDLLRHEAQAIMTGTLDANGVFHVTELNLKCPTRFIEGMPETLLEEGVVGEGA
mgnify:FL=1